MILWTMQKWQRKYNVTLTPSIVLLDAGENYRGVKFNGIPAGYEVNSFVTGLLEVSGAENDLPESISERLAKVEKPVNIKVLLLSAVLTALAL